MALQIHNTLTKRKEPFKPINAKNVRMYVCGITVYDYCHIGHARMLVVFDMIYRHLQKVYGPKHVTYIRNITDIDDKIIARANENSEAYGKLTSRFIDAMHEDTDALGILRPDEEPKATQHMSVILAMIQTLVDSGYAYVGENGDVFYSVRKFPQYGRLSGKKLDELQSGERIAVDDNKQDPLDFVLWKTAKPGEPSWPSFWGNGRPGWHIECSAMATHCLGNHFDIHGGGLDLQFPHHENEIAQSEAATHEKFVNVWMHNGFVRVDDEKMSKSLGNFFTIRDVLKSYDPEVLRFFILASHYRKPLNYSDVQLDNAKAGLSTLYMALRNMGPIPAAGRPEEIDQAYQDRFDQAMNDDFNTAEAIAVLFDIAKACNREKLSNSRQAKVLATTLRSLSASLGLLQREADTFFQSGLNSEVGADIGADDIEKQIAARDEAKKNRDWAKSDEIRDALTARGVVLEDGPTGTTWRRQ